MSDRALIEFLLARITEDEVRAKAATVWTLEGNLMATVHDARVQLSVMDVPTMDAYWDSRAFAECEAKRRIVEWMSDEVEYVVYGDDVLHALASVYAGHPDYRPEWRP